MTLRTAATAAEPLVALETDALARTSMNSLDESAATVIGPLAALMVTSSPTWALVAVLSMMIWSVPPTATPPESAIDTVIGRSLDVF